MSSVNFLHNIDKDPEIAALLNQEYESQEAHLELIASENYASKAVMEAQGSYLTNKYAEGYPGKRYYGGCDIVDQVELLAIERLKKLFKVQYANVQSHSGSQANQSVFLALLQPGDTILGMDLAAGGHLTHGSPVNISGKIYKAITYGLTPEGLIDYEAVKALAEKHKPQLIIAGASAYSRHIDWEIFSQVAKNVGAYFMCDVAHYSGLIVAGLYPSPVGLADVITTTTHKTLRGPRGGAVMTDSEAIMKKINSATFPALQGGPLMHVIAAKAVCFQEASLPEFKVYAQQVLNNAQVMAHIFKRRGFGIVSGATQSHMFLVDLRPKHITGKKAQEELESVGITVNKNSIPNDPESFVNTSGIRIGTAALTTRGLREKEVEKVANWICDILENSSVENKKIIKEKVDQLTRWYPVYK